MIVDRKLALEGRVLELRLRDFPAPLEPLIQRDLEKLVWLLPPWVTELYVEYALQTAPGTPLEEVADDADTIASVSVSYGYRNAAILIRPIYFDADDAPRTRREKLGHELIHVVFGPSHDTARRMLEEVLEKGSTIHRVTLARLSEGVEMAVQDMARAVLRDPRIVAALGLEDADPAAPE